MNQIRFVLLEIGISKFYSETYVNPKQIMLVNINEVEGKIGYPIISKWMKSRIQINYGKCFNSFFFSFSFLFMQICKLA